MTYENIKKALIKEKEQRFKDAVCRLDNPTEYQKTKEEALNHFVRWTLNKRDSYKGNYEEQRQKALNRYSQKLDKELNQTLERLQTVFNHSEPFKEFYITIEWKKSYMWGSNSTAEDSNGYTSGSIGGCGYCKESTATARILNQHNEILKLMYALKDMALKINSKATNHEVLTYGSGYGIIPRFEGGVGVSSHQTILENLGLRMESVSWTKTTTVYRVFEP